MLQTLQAFLILNGTAKTKLATLAFMYCGEYRKNSIIAMNTIVLTANSIKLAQ